jgi:hypothetical protein
MTLRISLAAALCSLLVPSFPSLASEDAAKGVETTEGWLFLGRRSDERWRPASRSIADPDYPVKPGGKVVVKQDALVYGSVDCRVIPAAEFKADGVSREVMLVKADREGLEIIAPALECPSAGQGRTVWANVRIPAARLLTVQR